MDPPLRVQNPGAPRPGRRGKSLQTGWEFLLADKDNFNAAIEKSKEDNQNLISRVSPSASRKLRTAADNRRIIVDALEPGLDEERLWDMDIVEKHSMRMVPVLVRTPHTHTHIYMLIIFKFELSKGNGKGEGGYIVADNLA
jgi:hypothetical protein